MMDATATKTATRIVNGLDLDALDREIADIRQDPANAKVAFKVSSAWKGQTRSEATVESYRLAGQEIIRRFTIPCDEPTELLGTNTAANPQETLMAALNACMMVGYVAGAAIRGIRLARLEMETSGELDLRGFLGLSEDVPAGYECVRTVVRIEGDGTPEQFREIHETVMKTSPNYFNVSRPVRIDASLEVIG